MKPCDVYGAKRAFKLYLLPAIALLVASVVFLVLTILWDIQVFYAFVAIAFVGGAYLLYLALYERNLRYKTLCSIEGKDTIATLTHVEQATGKISPKPLAYVEEDDHIIEGELHASPPIKKASEEAEANQMTTMLTIRSLTTMTFFTV